MKTRSLPLVGAVDVQAVQRQQFNPEKAASERLAGLVEKTFSEDKRTSLGITTEITCQGAELAKRNVEVARANVLTHCALDNLIRPCASLNWVPHSDRDVARINMKFYQETNSKGENYLLLNPDGSISENPKFGCKRAETACSESLDNYKKSMDIADRREKECEVAKEAEKCLKG